ncbi:homocysteine S-methyltransferase family protein [Desulfovibrio sp. OttesenSCG-928-G15]|nr:homocysteine S-methyltransferase family protein [Desulfovibrio sp. OttesenSCG-928-G15]
MSHFLAALASGTRLLFDGAMGTMLQKRGLGPGEEPERFCLEQPDVLVSIHREYALAGSDVLTTCTFGGSPFKLPAGLETRDFNKRMARMAREAAASITDRQVFVAGSVGPSGSFLRPLGDMAFEDMVRGFQEQILGLMDGGVDCILAETQFDIAEARAIVVAARRAGRCPVAVSMTYEEGKTLTGSGVEVCVATLANLGVDLIGINCSAGPVEMRPAIAHMVAASPVPILVQPNAGLPVLQDGVTSFPLQPQAFAEYTAEFAKAGVQAVGGCCGTTPEHIAALKKAIQGMPLPGARPVREGIAVSSRSLLVSIGKDEAFRIIGERINPTGKKQLSAELQAGEYATALRFAEEQTLAGADILDVNVGAPMVDEVRCLPDLVSRLCTQGALPLSLDSSNMDAIEQALALYPASALVNSISGEEGRLERLGPLCRDYGSPFILLPLKGKELPVKASERIAIVEDLLARMEALHIPRSLALVDALVLTVSSSPEAGRECLAFIRYCTEQLRLPVTCGLSNISFGLPARELVNGAFFSLAAGAGMRSCIANPSTGRIAEAKDAVNLLLGHDEGAESFVGRYTSWTSGQGGAQAGSVAAAGGAQVAATLENAVIHGRTQEVGALVQTALDAKEDPFAIVSGRLIPAIMQVGEKYEKKEYFLPQLIRSAETMQKAFALLRPLLETGTQKTERPVIVLATVEGDIHDIGKNIVNLMLANYGFDVVDAGKSVPAEQIVEQAIARGAKLIGLSALMTTTMVRMADTVALLKEKGADIPVMVGGAVVTPEYAKTIGAHYAKDAVEAVRVARDLL